MTGAGRAFCAGADLGGGPETFADRRTRERPPGPLGEPIGGFPRDAGGVASLPFAALRKPVIAAVNGPAVGIGATMTLPMDIRIAAESARFGFVVRPPSASCPRPRRRWFLPRVVGISQAMEWVATGRVFDAAEALRGRLVSRVVPDAELLPTALRARAGDRREHQRRRRSARPGSCCGRCSARASPWDAHRAESRALVELGDGPDAAEGVAAFLEKRPPRVHRAARRRSCRAGRCRRTTSSR